MKKPLYFIAVLAVAGFASCKTKKIIPSTPAGTETTAAPANDVQYDAYRNKLPATKVERVDKGIRVTFDSEILFPTNSSYLTEKAKADLKKLVDVLKQQGQVKIKVDGHTDKTGTPEYNKWLSDKRAVSVKTYAVSLGLPADIISTTGYGDTKPVADNKTAEGRAKNRRVEITITPVK